MNADIITPTLVLDVDRCKQNIQKMAIKARDSKVVFRPHFKTHQSIEIGRWFKDLNVQCITVSSLRMAAYFSADWDDITVAFPVNILEIDLINELAKKITLNLLVESIETVQFLHDHLSDQVGCFIKIDTGYQRTGVPGSKVDVVDELIHRIESSPKIQFKGFLSHSGHTYSCRTKEEIEAIYKAAASAMNILRNRYINKFPNLIVSYGDTPSCSLMDDFSDFDEIRPGNFVFYDVTQSVIGSCQTNDIAVALACPLVAIHKDRNELVIYGGGIHFSKDRVEENGKIIFGKVVERIGTKWGSQLDGMWVKSLSQEHGIIHCSPNKIDDFKVGDLLYILPVHSCMAADLMKKYLTTDHHWIDCMPLKQ